MASNRLFPLAALLLAVTQQLTCSAAAYVPAYPGREAYEDLEDHLHDHGLDVKDVEGNLKLIEELASNGDQMGKMKQAAQLVLSLRELYYAEEGCQGFEVLDSIKRNTEGAMPADNYLRFDHNEHLNTSMTANVITFLVDQLLVKCEKFVELELKQAAELLPDPTGARFKSYWSDELIEQYSDEPEGQAKRNPKLGHMKGNKPFDDFGYYQDAVPLELLLNRLFQVGELGDDDGPLVEIDYENLQTTWRRLKENKLKQLVERHLVDPCKAFVHQTKHNLIGAYYYFGAYYMPYGMGGSTYDLERLHNSVRPEFFYRLFAYEFCHKFSKLPLWSILWDKYEQVINYD